MKGIRTSIAAGLLAAAVAVSLAAWNNGRPGPAADAQPWLLPEVVITARAPRPPMMDTVYVSATRETGSGIAARGEAGREPIAGYALGLLPRISTDPDAVLGLFWNVAAGSFQSASRLLNFYPALGRAW